MITPAKIHTENIPGNIHNAACWINEQGWAEYLLQLDFSGSGHNTVAVFKMPAQMVRDIRAKNVSYVADPGHDDVGKDK